MKRWACLAAVFAGGVAEVGAQSPAPAGGATVAAALDPIVASTTSGGTLNVRVRFAVSGADSSGLVVWLAQAHTPAQAFGQNESLQFVSATVSGQFADSDSVVSGASVPAGSVFWVRGSLPTGTYALDATLRVPPGALNGTQYRLRAFARNDGNGATGQSVERSMLASATPQPAVALRAGEGWIEVEGTPQAGPGSVVQFVVGAPLGGSNNAAGNGVETLHQARAWVPLGPLCALDASPPATCVAAVSDLSDGGAGDAAFDPDGAGSLPAVPAVVWSLPSIAPGASVERRFRFALPAGVPDPTALTLAASLDSARSAAVSGSADFTIGIDDTPRVAFALGDDLGGTISITPAFDDNGSERLRFGQIGALFAQLRNTGAVALGDALVFVRVPAGVLLHDVQLPSGGMRAFVSTSPGFDDPATPPPTDLTSAIGTAAMPDDIDASGQSHWLAWDPVPPPEPATVRWLALYFAQLPVGDPPAQASLLLRAALPNCTASQPIATTPLRVHAFTPAGGGAEVAISPGPLTTQDQEPLRLHDLPLQLQVVASGPSSHLAGDDDPAQFEFTVSHDEPIALQDAALLLSLSELSINGVPSRPALVAAGGGQVDLSGAADGVIGVLFDPIAPGASRTATLALDYPIGVQNLALHSITAEAEAPGAGCNAGAASDLHQLVLVGTPLLQVNTSADQATLAPGGDLAFTGRHRNSGTVVAQQTFVFGRVPAHTTFMRAELAAGRRLLCSAPPLDAGLPDEVDDPDFEFDSDVFATQFVPGLSGADGWTCPQGEETSWVALALDDESLTPPVFAAGADETWRLRLHNDEVRDEPDGQQQGSPLGTQISFELGMRDEATLQATSNSSSSTVGAAPLQASCAPPPFLTRQAIDYAIPTTNGVAPLTFSLLTGSLPGCIALDAEGRLRGATSLPGVTEVTVRILDGDSREVDVVCSLQASRSGIFADGLEDAPRSPSEPPDPCP